MIGADPHGAKQKCHNRRDPEPSSCPHVPTLPFTGRPRIRDGVDSRIVSVLPEPLSSPGRSPHHRFHGVEGVHFHGIRVSPDPSRATREVIDRLGSAALHDLPRPVLGPGLDRAGGRTQQQDAQTRTVRRPALDVDVATRLAHDPEASGQAQTRPLAHRLAGRGRSSTPL